MCCALVLDRCVWKIVIGWLLFILLAQFGDLVTTLAVGAVD